MAVTSSVLLVTNYKKNTFSEITSHHCLGVSPPRARGVAQAPHALALRGGGRLPSFAVNLLVEQLASQEAWVKVIKA